MRLERMRDMEIERRRGMTAKTLLALLWLGLCYAAAYFATIWLIDNGLLSVSSLYSRLLIPRDIDHELVIAGFVTALVMLMQFFVLVGYAFASPLGRMRPGRPSLRSPKPDIEDRYFYR
ncbi:MAG: hypothetical protein ACRDHL_11405 [Candidatus Promineifilaceae bacterium]